MNIKYSEDVVGCRIGGTIYLHPQLKEHPELYKAVLKHEKGHTSGFSFKDFLMDLSNDELGGVKREYYKFMWDHPRTMKGFLPISKMDGKWAMDVSLMFIWGFSLLILLGGLKVILQ